ncbi:MAG: PAS domain-containing sensor histidine kinase [Alphaproteobacteria bacterium]
MNAQGSESKSDFVRDFLKLEGRSGLLRQFLFLFCGLCLTLSAFFILQSFVYRVVEDEKSRISQDFVEEVVRDFNALARPLAGVSELIALSGGARGEDIRQVMEQKRSDYAHFSQIIWFYKAPSGKWTYYTLLGEEAGGENIIRPDSAFLKAALGAGAADKAGVEVLADFYTFQTLEHRGQPKIVSRPFLLARAVSLQDKRRGFVVAVMDGGALFSERWIADHRMLSFMRVRDVEAKISVLEFDRSPHERLDTFDGGPVYEFSFAGRNFEVSSVFLQDRYSGFLNGFPYVLGFFGLFLVGAGTLYIRKNQQQSEALVRLNDILERKNYELQAEAEERERLNKVIRDAEKKSRAVVDAVGDIIFEADEDGRIVFLNHAWKSITGFDVKQSVGQTLEQLVHPEDKERLLSDFSSLVSGQGQNARIFTQVRASDGTFKAVELSMKAVKSVGSGGVSVIGTFTDIEERRKVERALSHAEKKYRSIVENAAGGIFQLTQEGLYLSANPAFARILGYYSPEQLLREVKNANEQLYLDPARRQAFYKELVHTRGAVTRDTQIRKRDGKIIWVQESVRAVKDDNGALLFFEGSVEDITQRRESELAVYEAKVHSDLANRAKSEFLSNMSHELRTPLNSIIGFSEMIKDEIYGKIEQRSYWEYARDIHESGQKLLRVINEILDISKIEAGERQLNEGVVNIGELVDGAVQLLETKIENAQVVITRALDDVPEIVGEELALKQVVLNLLSNAVKFTPDQGRITISGHVGRDGRFHFSVTDTGIGLDEYEIRKALSPFGQVDNELSRSGSGTGLGLTLVDALVKLHGGEFELFSQKGIGTTATVILPADRIVRPSGKGGNSGEVEGAGEEGCQGADVFE